MKATHEAYQKKLTQDIEAALEERVLTLKANAITSAAADAIAYSLAAGGKRIRPILTLEFCRICGGSQAQAQSAACAVEMMHTFSLIHDDLPEMDDDDFRRGKPACHKAFGHAVALQAGDALALAAAETILCDAALSAEYARKATETLLDAAGVAGMVGGQVLDMAFEANPEQITLSALEKMVSAKTGALLRAACQMGCIVAGAGQKELAIAEEYAENLGLAFQIVDDILDVTSTTETLGKPVGSDAAEGKVTLVSLMGFEAAQMRAAQATEAAKQVIKQLPDHDFLLDLTEELLTRKK